MILTVLVPERPYTPEQFLGYVQNALREWGWRSDTKDIGANAADSVRLVNLEDLDPAVSHMVALSREARAHYCAGYRDAISNLKKGLVG